MNWCWQQDPKLRPTASQVVESVKSEEFCCLLNGICINDYGKVLCVYSHKVHNMNHQKKNKSLLNRDSLKPLDSSAILQSENQYSASDCASKNTAKHEIWLSSSNNIQSSMVTILEYCGKFTAVEVRYVCYIYCTTHLY